MKIRLRHLAPALLAVLCLLGAPLHAAPLPGGFAHSGWYQFEVIVMIDTRSETLESETWPLLPTVGYPSRWRWLQDTATQRTLEAEYPDAMVTSSPAGHLTVRLPAPQIPLWEPQTEMLTEGDMSVIDELIGVSQGSDTFALYALSATDAGTTEESEQAPARPVLPFEEIAPAPEEPTPLLALESLGVALPDNAASETPINIPFAPAVEAIALTPVTVTAQAIPTPASFVQLPLDQLAPGLARYRRSSEDDVVASVSWLQGPESDTLPILLEADADTGYPTLQGFIQLIPRGDSWRMGLNFWANTAGHYLPDIFEMPGPPPSPERITFVEPSVTSIPERYDPTVPTHSEAGDNMGPVSWLWNEGDDAAGTSDQTLTGRALKTDPTAPVKPDWPWRHLIHVADTIPLTENRLRYYDHPVVKVLAIWRELSWYELFIQGKALMDEPELEPALVAHNATPTE